MVEIGDSALAQTANRLLSSGPPAGIRLAARWQDRLPEDAHLVIGATHMRT